MRQETRDKKQERLVLALCVGAVLLISGCGVKTRAYIADRKRVDIEPSGNGGYLMGQAPAETTQVEKDTRKVIMFEFIKDENDLQNELVQSEMTSTDYVASENSYSGKYQKSASKKTVRPQAQPSPQPRNLQIPVITDDDYYLEERKDAPLMDGKVVDYEVEKNDTLQKISKKFYGSYSKWPRIFDANKDVLKDPNFVKPGIVIKIPLDEQ